MTYTSTSIVGDNPFQLEIQGFNLRTYIAAQVMAALSKEFSAIHSAELAVQYADALIAELEKVKK